MKKSILLMLVAALALSVGLGSAAGAGADNTGQASAKKKGKAKGCKGKKGKAGKSAAASKKKGKAKGCKPKPKGEPKQPGTPTPPPPPTPSSWPLTDGTYEGQETIGLVVTSGATQASLTYAPGFGDTKTCLGLFPTKYAFPAEPATSSSTSFKAGGKPVAIAGNSGEVKWTIEVTPDLHYKVMFDSKLEFAEQKPCNKPAAEFVGTLTKAS